jgi:hypothetical protein
MADRNEFAIARTAFSKTIGAACDDAIHELKAYWAECGVQVGQGNAITGDQEAGDQEARDQEVRDQADSLTVG